MREVLDAERILVSYQVRALDAERDAVVEACTLLEVVGALTARALGIEGLADLDREAEEARRNLAPGWLSLRRSRGRALARHLDGAQAPRLDTGSRFFENRASFGKCFGIVAARSGVWGIRTGMFVR